MTRRLLLVLALLAPPSYPSRGDDPPEDVGAKALAFARSRIGEQVGDGQCTALVREALRVAGARPLHASGSGRGFSWGTPVDSVKEARPGDVVQFEEVTFRGRRRIVGEDGSPRLSLVTVRFPHHSAIVAAVGPKGRTLTILHQNVGRPDGSSDLKVQEATLVLSEMRKGGTLKVFRPVAP